MNKHRRENLIFDSLPNNGKTWPLLNSADKKCRSLPTIREARRVGIPKMMTDELRDELGIEREWLNAV